MKMRVKLKGTRLTAIRFIEMDENGKSRFLFKCDCGNRIGLRKDNNLDQGGTHGVSLHHAVYHENGGSLNPTWVEWLMGYPIGWTDLED